MTDMFTVDDEGVARWADTVVPHRDEPETYRIAQELAQKHGPVKIRSKRELVAVTTWLGVAGYCHEPDENDVDASVYGHSFDNAGFWPLTPGIESICEIYTALTWRGVTVAYVNLANLIEWATG